MEQIGLQTSESEDESSEDSLVKPELLTFSTFRSDLAIPFERFNSLLDLKNDILSQWSRISVQS